MSSETLNLVLALVSLGISLVLAIFGVWLQLFSYRGATEQAQDGVKEMSDLRAQMGDMLGRIEGATKTMSETQQNQFQLMLNAFVAAPRAIESVANASEQSESEISRLKSDLTNLATKLQRSSSDAELKDELASIQNTTDNISSAISSVNRELRSVQDTSSQHYAFVSNYSVPLHRRILRQLYFRPTYLNKLQAYLDERDIPELSSTIDALSLAGLIKVMSKGDYDIPRIELTPEGEAVAVRALGPLDPSLK